MVAMNGISVCFANALTAGFHGVRLAQAPTCQRGPGAAAILSTRRAHAMMAADGETKQPSVDTPAPAPPASANNEMAPVRAPIDEPVPGKIVLTELEIAAQKTALDKYTMELRKKQQEIDREASRLFGFVPYAETLNGRLAMFFIVTGVLTEYWTGYTLPQQVELLLRTLGFF